MADIKNHWENAQVKQVPLDELRLDPQNTNKHSDEQITIFAKVIEYQGFRWPLLVSHQSGVVKAGEGRYLAAKKLGMKTVPVVFQDFENEDQERAFGISDNAVALQAELDFSMINSQIQYFGPDFEIELLAIPEFAIDVSEKDPKKERKCPHCGETL